MNEINFAHLNEMQRQAVEAADGALLLLAGAGSGKTTVLMNRIANLIANKGVRPYEIIAITFTNKAAGEMKERLAQMSIPGADEVWASTFHSACARILRIHIDKLGFDKNFTIYDTADCVSLMKRILKDMREEEKAYPPKTVLSYISHAKDAMTTPEEYMRAAEKHGDPRRMVIAEAYDEYEKRMKTANALDFDDLMLLTVRLFDKCPDVLEHYQKRFKYVLVDEYQDTNNLQYRLTSALAGGHGNICVVGDDDQSIYKFRGATIENILSFEKQYKDARVIRLEQNYRSTGAILSAANDVIARNKGRKGKTLWTANGDGDLPDHYVVTDEREEAQFVARTIQDSVREGRKWSDHVILYRMNAQSNQFETAFKRSGIPYRVYGGTGFFERAEIKDMLAYLCVIHNPDDDVRLMRIINNPARGLGDTTLARLAAIAEDNGTSAFRAISQAHKYENVRSAAPKLAKFADMIEELRELAQTAPLEVLYDELLNKTGYLRALAEKKSDENLSRIENVRELKTSIIAFNNESGGSLFDFLSEMALYTDLDRDDQSTDKVMMMTMHSAKGLEFDTVFIAGAEEELFPSMRSLNDPAEIEEERRLCYVAMTRAIRKLYLISAKRRMIFGRTNYSQPSRFVGEIAKEHVELHDISEDTFGDYGAQPRWGEHRPPAAGDHRSPLHSPSNAVQTFRNHSIDNRRGELRSPAGDQRSPLHLNVGDTVEHKSFGKGIVKSIEPVGGDALLVIDFDNHGEKRLLKNSAAPFMTKP